MRAPAACGGCREPSISAAVEKPEDQREPERFFGHRKADQILPPQPSKKPLLSTKRTRGVFLFSSVAYGIITSKKRRLQNG